ncbi:hypothetical protein V5799_031194 [Amblyomma americanum]|uniref:Uncharacterized protein n=1 Tax=Amblyomma americanum TaxID=6943 RepID=A0AAQ4EKZ2_AMBAM
MKKVAQATSEAHSENKKQSAEEKASDKHEGSGFVRLDSRKDERKRRHEFVDRLGPSVNCTRYIESQATTELYGIID